MAEKRTIQAEEYLESMARLREDGKRPSVSALAAELRVSKASVSEMLQKMREKGLIRYTPYSCPELTEKGRRFGSSLLRKHRLLHRFLELIGVKKRKVHKEACVLEHSLSDEVEKCVQRMLKKEKNAVRLSTLKKGTNAVVVGIAGCQKICRRLTDLGMTKGTRITLLKSAPFKGPFTVSVRRTVLAIGNSVASKILVRSV